MAGGDDENGKPGPKGLGRASEPAMPLPPADDQSRLTLNFEIELPPLAFEDEGDDEFASGSESQLELPASPSKDRQSEEALELVGSRDSHLAIDLRTEMRELFALDDFTAALSIAELLLGQDETDEDAAGVASECRRRLVQLFTSRIGDLNAVPRTRVRPEEVRWLGLDHRGGFLLSQINGSYTVEELCDVSSMPRLDTLKTIVELKDAGAIEI